MADHRDNVPRAARPGGGLMSWGRYIQRIAVRRVVWIVVGVLVYAAIGLLSRAEAGLLGCGPGNPCPRGEAYSLAQQHVQQVVSSPESWVEDGLVRHVEGPPPFYEARCGTAANPNMQSCGTGSTYYYTDCPAGTEWRDDLKRCFNPEECLNRNDNIAARNSVQTFTTGCIDGCWMEPQLPMGCSSIIGSGNQVCAAQYAFTGATCDVPPPADPPNLDNPEQERCQTWTQGATYCKQADGNECYTSKTGRRFCWRPTQTGSKTDGPLIQTRTPGTTPAPPPTPPPGEAFEPIGDSVTTETTTTTESGTTTTTTTVNNYETVYGTDAGGPGARDDGQNEDGTGGEGEDGEEGSFTGGDDCSAPPVCAGDPILCAIAKGQWETRCAGGVDGDGGTGLIGDAIGEAEGVLGDAAGDEEEGEPDETEMLEHADPDSWRTIEIIDDEGLDATGLGFDRSCPQLPPVSIAGANLQFDLGPICNFLSSLSGLVLALSYFIAARIIAGVK